MLQLPSLLTHAQVGDVNTWRNAAQAANWQIDASSMQRFDSSTLALLLDLQRCSGGQLRLHGVSAPLGQLAHLYGISDLLKP